MKKLALVLGGITLAACSGKIYKGVKNIWDSMIFKDIITLRRVIKQYDEIMQTYPSYLNDAGFLEFKKTYNYDADDINNMKDHLFSDLKKDKLIQMGTTMEAFIEYSGFKDDKTASKICWKFISLKMEFDTALLQLQDIDKVCNV